MGGKPAGHGRAWKRSSKVATERLARRSHSCGAAAGSQARLCLCHDQEHQQSAQAHRRLQTAEFAECAQRQPLLPVGPSTLAALDLTKDCATSRQIIHNNSPMREHAPHAFAVASSEPLTSSGGPRFSGQQLLTKLSCSAIFFTCAGAAYVSNWCAAPPPPPPLPPPWGSHR